MTANPLFELEAGITPCFFMRMSHAQTVNPCYAVLPLSGRHEARADILKP